MQQRSWAQPRPSRPSSAHPPAAAAPHAPSSPRGRPVSARASFAGRSAGGGSSSSGQALQPRQALPPQPQALPGAVSAALYPLAAVKHLLGVEGAAKSLEGSRALLSGWKGKALYLSDPQATGREMSVSGGLSGGAVTAWMQEQWAELHAWCGFLAANLEGSCAKIESLGAERRQHDRERTELRGRCAYLEHLCSQRNTHILEQRIEGLQEKIDGFGGVRAELDAARRTLEEGAQERQRLTTAKLASDAAQAAMQKQIQAAEEAAERMAAELAEERARRSRAEQDAQRLAEEGARASAEASEATAQRIAAEAAAQKSEAETARRVAELEAAHAKALRRAEQEHARTRTQLAEARERLSFEIGARANAERRSATAGKRLDGAMRACKQWEEKATAAAATAAASSSSSSRPLDDVGNGPTGRSTRTIASSSVPTSGQAAAAVHALPSHAEPPPRTREPPQLAANGTASMSSASLVASMVLGSRSPTNRASRASEPPPRAEPPRDGVGDDSQTGDAAPAPSP